MSHSRRRKKIFRASNEPAGRFIQLRVEAEIAFVMMGKVGEARVAHEEIYTVTESVAPPIEMLGARIVRKDA